MSFFDYPDISDSDLKEFFKDVVSEEKRILITSYFHDNF